MLARTPEDYSALSGLALDMAAIDIDRRERVEMLNLPLGRTQPETAARLEQIVDDYRRLAPECHRASALDRRTVDRKLAGAIRSLAIARSNLGELAEAGRLHREAEKIYTALGAPSDARACASGIADLRLRAERDVDAALAELHARLEAATQPLDRADVDLDLADLHFSRHDGFGAEEYLRDASRLLGPYEHRASGAATAEALASSMSQLLRGGAFEPGGIEETMRIRALLARLYRGLARVWPDRAADYQERLLQLEGSIEQGSHENSVFSEHMLARMKAFLDQDGD